MARLAPGCDRPAQVFSESGVRRFLPLAQRGIEPGSGKRPVAVGGTADDAQSLGRLVEREPREETELDQLGTGGIYLCPLVQGGVKIKQLVRRFSGGEGDLFAAQPPPAPAPLAPAPPPRPHSCRPPP